jgi:hypothetical protein
VTLIRAVCDLRIVGHREDTQFDEGLQCFTVGHAVAAEAVEPDRSAEQQSG